MAARWCWTTASCAASFRLAPNAATVSFENLMTGESIIRAVRPEACVVLDGVRYEVGGLRGQPLQSFLKPAWIETLKANPEAFQFAALKTGATEARFPWKKRREWMPKDAPWPPPGVSLTLEFRPPAGSGGAGHGARGFGSRGALRVV